MYSLLRVISPPLGLGKKCPHRVACKVWTKPLKHKLKRNLLAFKKLEWMSLFITFITIFFLFQFIFILVWFFCSGFCIIQLFESHFTIESFGGGSVVYAFWHDNENVWDNAEMRTHTLLYTHSHTHTGSGVWSMRWCTALAIVFWLNAGGITLICSLLIQSYVSTRVWTPVSHCHLFLLAV